MKKGSESTTTIEIEPNKSLRDYIGNKTNDQLSEYEKGIKTEFNLKIKDILNFDCSICQPCYNGLRLPEADIILLIANQFGFSFMTTPYGKFEIIKEWLINNHHKRTLILQKGYHYTMISEDAIGYKEYQDWYNNHEKRSAQ